MNGAVFWRRLRAHFDWPLVLTVLAIASIGLVNLYSATRAAPRGGEESGGDAVTAPSRRVHSAVGVRGLFTDGTSAAWGQGG